MNPYALDTIIALERAKAEIIKKEAHEIAARLNISIIEAIEYVEKAIAMASLPRLNI